MLTHFTVMIITVAPLPEGGGEYESAGVAQLAEQLFCKQQVAGSSPTASLGAQAFSCFEQGWGTRAVKGTRL